MFFYHHGAAVQPSVVHVGHTFVARALIQNEDGETESLLNLGTFANRNAAMQFAIVSALAYVEGKPLPPPPVKIFHSEDVRRQPRTEQKSEAFGRHEVVAFAKAVSKPAHANHHSGYAHEPNPDTMPENRITGRLLG